MSLTAQTLLKLAILLARSPLDYGGDPQPGDLVVEQSTRRVDPDGIGWLVAHGMAPYEEDDPTYYGSVPMREVWDVIPLNPDAEIRAGLTYQRWENARFIKVPDHILARLPELRQEARAHD